MRGMGDADQEKKSNHLTRIEHDRLSAAQMDPEYGKAEGTDYESDHDLGDCVQSQHDPARREHANQHHSADADKHACGLAAPGRQHQRATAIKASCDCHVSAWATEPERSRLGPADKNRGELACYGQEDAEPKSQCPTAGQDTPFIVAPKVEKHPQAAEQQKRRISQVGESLE